MSTVFKNRKLTVTLQIKAAAIGAALVALTRVAARLCRLHAFRGEEHLERLLGRGQPVILCLWHDRLAYLPWFMSERLRRADVVLHALISRSRDGEVMASVATRFGYRVVRGSTSRGGVSGLRAMARVLRNGDSVATVGDGPRGPRHRLKRGPIALAKLTGAPVLPITYGADRAWVLNSWDRFVLPKPLSRIVVVIGEPFFVDRKASEEALGAAAAELEKRMRDSTCEAERLVVDSGAPGAP